MDKREQITIDRKTRKFVAILCFIGAIIGLLSNIGLVSLKGLISAYASCILLGLGMGILLSLTNKLEWFSDKREQA